MRRGGVGVAERAVPRREDEVAALFALHYRSMCRLAYVILGDAQAAEEIVMDALVKTFSGWWRIRDPDRADVYLRRAVVNLCKSRIRRKALETRTASDAMGAPQPQGWDPEIHERVRLVWDAVRTLPERQRACVVLRYFEDLPEAAIADALGCSTGTVKSQLSKARAKLERELAQGLEGGSA